MNSLTEIITTHDIQILEIALIYYHTEGSKVLSEEDYNRLSEILVKMNRLCTKENGYSLEMTVRENGK